MAETLVMFPPATDVEAIHAEHMRWLATGGKEGRRAHFRRTDLSRLDLSGSRFAEASMRGITIRSVNFSGADLRACDLAETYMEDVDLSGALLSGANLSRARLINVNLEGADLSEANLQGINAKDVAFASARMNNANLRDASLPQADFARATLRDANLRGAQCAGGRFDHADLSNAECRQANFDQASFTHANVRGAGFKGASLNGIDLHQVDFSVALDVTFDTHTQSLLAERAKLQEEQKLIARQMAHMEDMRETLRQERQKFMLQKASLAASRAHFAEVSRYVQQLSGVFGVMAVLWFVLSGGLMFLTYQRVTEFGASALSGVLVAVCMVLALSFLSLYFTVKLRAVLAKATKK